MKIIKIPLSVAGIDNAIREINRYQSWLEAKTSVLLDRLAQEGLSVASANFAKAAYDGTNDVSVFVEQIGALEFGPWLLWGHRYSSLSSAPA